MRRCVPTVLNSATARLPISVLIYTKNEEQDLPGCLESVSWSDDIVVLDSCSEDRTVEIAHAYGARVFSRPFDTESVHKNWALANIDFRYPWIYHSDADERVTCELAAEMQLVVSNSTEFAAYRCSRRDYWGDAWLKHCVPSPFNIRLFLRDKMRYERLTNPVSVVDGAVGELSGYFEHFPFSKGIAHWFLKHNVYSTREAEQIIANRRANATFSLAKAFTAKDSNERRYHQKELFYRLPARPLMKFLLLYGLKMGFLDGRAGFSYSMLQSIYEYMIVLKTREMEREQWNHSEG